MALKIKIKHNVTGKVLPLHLKYDDPNTNFPEISVNMRDSEQDVTLSNWNIGADGIDAEKIKISEVQYQDGNDVYKINSVNIGIDAGPGTASEEVEDEMSHRDPSTITEPTCDDSLASNWDAIAAAHAAKNYSERTRLIKEDPTKFLYDRSYDIRHTNYSESHYTDEEFAAEYGDVVTGAILTTKAGVLSYGSIFFGTVLIEANSRYAKVKDWEKSSFMTQTINEEGRKNGCCCHGYMRNNKGTQVLSYRVPDLTDTIIVNNELYSGDINNSSVLTVCFVPSYSEASTAYRPASGTVFIDDVQVNSGLKPFVRVRIDNGEHVVRAGNVKYGGKTNWNTLGNHHITTPLYSDNILKIVLFNDDADHGIYPNLYLQAKNNRWGLPCSMFENGGSDTPSGSDDPSVTPPAGSEVANIGLKARLSSKPNGSWWVTAYLDARNSNIEYPVTFKLNGNVVGNSTITNTGAQFQLSCGPTNGVVEQVEVVPAPYVMDGNTAYEIPDEAIEISYDVLEDVQYTTSVWRKPSNESSLNFNYAALDRIALFGALADGITVPDTENGTITLSGDIDTLYKPGTSGMTAVSNRMDLETEFFNYERQFMFGGGMMVMGPFKATVNGDEGYVIDMPSGMRIAHQYYDMTNNFVRRQVKYTHNGTQYTGIVYIDTNEGDIPYTAELHKIIHSSKSL